MRLRLVLLPMLFAAPLLVSALGAQSSSAAQLTIAADNGSCPVQFRAQRWNDARALKDVEVRRPGAAERGLYLRAEHNGAGKEVGSATVIVHGSALAPRLSPARSSGPGELEQTFRLAELPRDHDGNWKLTTDRVPLIRLIEITEMHFVDGSVWQASQDARCRFTPDGFLPVASLR